MRPDRFAIDLLLDGPRPVTSTALFANLWRYVSPTSPLHGRYRQRISFGLIQSHPLREPNSLPRLRIYSTDPDFSAALATQLLLTRHITIGKHTYRIAGQAAVNQLDAELIDIQTPIIIKTATPNPDNPRRPFSRCVTHEDPFFYDRLQRVMRDKLQDCGFDDSEIPKGPLVSIIAARCHKTQIKEGPAFLPGVVGRFQLHGPPAIRKAMLLSGLGVKTGMGFGFAVPTM